MATKLENKPEFVDLFAKFADEFPPLLPIAEGQELLGPCLECAGYWTRFVVRGQKPRTCPVCKGEVEA